MKYNDRLLRDIEKDGIKLNITSIQETNNMNEIDISYIAGEESGQNYEKTKKFIETYNNAKIYGSLIKVDEFDKEFFEKRLDYISNNPVEKIEHQSSKNKQVDELLEKLIKQAEIMVPLYDVLVTNPPYMGGKYMNAELSKFIQTNYKEYKSDMFSAFMSYSVSKVKCNGQLGFITPFVWMFLSTYEDLRKYIVQYKNISTLIQLEYNAFEAACVPACTFTLRNYNLKLVGEYIKLTDFTGSENQPIKTLEAIKDPDIYYRYSSISNEFNRIKGTPIAYWASQNIKNIFKDNLSLGEVGEPKQGLATGDNNTFLKMWFEINFKKIGFKYKNREEALISKKKWFPCNKGGAVRKWYGNNYYVVNWENDGFEMRNFFDSNGKLRSRPQNLNYFFEKGLTWSTLTSASLSVRSCAEGFIFETKGSMYFPNDYGKIEYLLGYLNSKLVNHLIKMISPSLDYHEGPIGRLPIVFNNTDEIKKIVTKNIDISKNDWDSFEISWEFSSHPILMYRKHASNINKAYSDWKEFEESQFFKLKENEEELNRIFIDIYGLQDEMTPEVGEKDVTIRKADSERDIKSFISYAIGCMVGRYSLDEEGLIYAGGEFDPSKYKTFKADTDGILPILSQNYFEDDVTTRFVEFVKVTFGEETLNENLDYISETLGKKNDESSRDAIRRYLIDGFYEDHCKIYKNRPIYWLVDSGKKKGFRALIYIHRYNTETLATLRLNYLLELQAKYINEEKQINKYLENENLSVSDKKNYNKKLLDLSQMQIELLAFDKVLDEMANRKIELDLDDGVIENHKKLQGILAKIK